MVRGASLQGVCRAATSPSWQQSRGDRDSHCMVAAALPAASSSRHNSHLPRRVWPGKESPELLPSHLREGLLLPEGFQGHGSRGGSSLQEQGPWPPPGWTLPGHLCQHHGHRPTGYNPQALGLAPHVLPPQRFVSLQLS